MKNKGFTLIELLVVVAVISILSLILVPNVRENLRRAKVAKTKALIGSLEVAIAAYKNDFGKYPESFNPQKFYEALVNQAKSPFDPNRDDLVMFKTGKEFWIKEETSNDDRRSRILKQAGVLSKDMVAQEDEYVFVDAWKNPIYFISSEVYNPGGKTDFRQVGKIDDNKPCAYMMRNGKRYQPFKPSTYQLISFGPDETTITPSTSNGGIGSMIDTDKEDNDNDKFFDNEDRVRNGDIMQNGPEVVAEDDITNFN